MIRVSLLAFITALPVIGGRLAVLFGQTSPALPSDPWSLATQLGIGGAFAAAVWLWQRDTAKQRDKAVEQVSEFTKIIGEMRDAVNQSTAAHEASTKAMIAMTDVLKDRPPTRVLVNRLTDAVASLEQMTHGER